MGWFRKAHCTLSPSQCQALEPLPWAAPAPSRALSRCSLYPPALLLKGLGLAGSRQRGCPSLSSWVLGLLAVP